MLALLNSQEVQQIYIKNIHSVIGVLNNPIKLRMGLVKARQLDSFECKVYAQVRETDTSQFTTGMGLGGYVGLSFEALGVDQDVCCCFLVNDFKSFSLACQSYNSLFKTTSTFDYLDYLSRVFVLICRKSLGDYQVTRLDSRVVSRVSNRYLGKETTSSRTLVGEEISEKGAYLDRQIRLFMSAQLHLIQCPTYEHVTRYQFKKRERE